MDDDDLRDLFRGLGPITIRRMFGGKGIYHNGLITALVVQGEVLLKADTRSAPEFEAAGCTQWTYESRSGKMAAMPYWSVPDSAIDDHEEMTIWARKAYEASVRAKA
ncbi:MAG: TfoX/Sxy family protein [Rhizobiaceae bacterium]|nr:TfoX/Sxy family protein [Rhizobiaceae bacterium]